LREHGTERAYSSPLNDETRRGTYLCRGCDLPLYSSDAKYDSGTGWPSFYESLRGAIGTQEDRRLLRVRTEVHCRRCGGHLGHVFNDGPQPTGKRHCINGVSLDLRTEGLTGDASRAVGVRAVNTPPRPAARASPGCRSG
jgi:peptide-methionine (R)-S-oxide reductase